jgi:hypothetical protein
MTFARMDSDVDADLEMIVECDAARVEPSSESDPDNDSDDFPRLDVIAQARKHSLAKLQSGSSADGGSSGRQSRRSSIDTGRLSDKKAPPAAQATSKRRLMNGPDAVIVLKEERVCYPFPVTFDAKAFIRQTHFTTFSNTYTHSNFSTSVRAMCVLIILSHSAWNVPLLGITPRAL